MNLQAGDEGAASAPIHCPQCGNKGEKKKIYKCGTRQLADDSTVQRYLCMACGFRFSDPNRPKRKPLKPLQNFSKQSLNSANIHNFSRQACDEAQGRRALAARKRGLAVLATVDPQKESPKREGTTPTPTSQADVQGKIVEFLWWMRKEGFSESTIVGKGQILRRLVKLGANLFEPETVKDTIAMQNWSPGRRANAVYAYALFAKWIGLSWTPPRIKIPEKLPFIPQQQELNDLVAGCTKHVSVALQIAMETGARIGEIFRLKWRDIDLQNSTIIITPEKGSSPRIFKMSPRLRQMLENLPKDGDRILSRYTRINSLRRTFEKQRSRIAFKLGNPRLLRISFHTFRHWKATWEYYKTKDILHVMQLLGHKRIQNTLKYTQLAKFEGEDQYICKVAKTPNEIAELIEAGFSYVCEKDGYLFFKKPK